MNANAKSGILLLNLGTPESPSPEAVGAYLKEFLMDPWVIDIPAPLRWFLVNALIVPRRKHASAALYQKIWQPDGSPLLTHTLKVAERLQETLGSGIAVEPCMRYGQPSVGSAVEKLKARGVERFLVAPLYPQYSLAATESSVRHVSRLLPQGSWKSVPAFYSQSWYLDAVADVSRPYLEGKVFDKYLFSFHGLPERHVRKTDNTKSHCLNRPNCCEEVVAANDNCYRAQCYATAREVARRLHIPPHDYVVCFQSRLNEKWIRPFSDDFYRNLPKQGVRRVAVLCPSFVADCLETLEEVAIRGKEEFCAHGGEVLELVPSLNSSEVWVNALAKGLSPYLMSR